VDALASEAMKGVVSCDKPRGVANRRRSGDSRIGKPIEINLSISIPESIGDRGEPGELKHLSTLRKGKKPRFSK
jgi:hypothetical protein